MDSNGTIRGMGLSYLQVFAADLLVGSNRSASERTTDYRSEIAVRWLRRGTSFSGESCQVMLRVGIVGIGFMGWIHWLAWQRCPDARVVAIASRSAQRRQGDWTGIQGNFGPAGEVVDLDGVQAFETVEELCASPDVDVVDICLPPHLHLHAIQQAAQAGKSVFCEKPLTLNLSDADRAIEICQMHNVRLLVGHVLPFFLEYQFARNAVADGRFGPLLGGRFSRVISDPTWIPDFYDAEKVGGPLIDLHVHDAHFMRLIFGMPQSVFSRGRRRGDVVEYVESLFGFAGEPSPVVSANSGVIHQQGRPFMHGYEIHFERATLQFSFAALSDEPEVSPLKVLHEDGRIERPNLGNGDPVEAFVAEIEEVARAIGNPETSSVLEGGLARDAIAICAAEAESVAAGAAVDLNGTRKPETSR